MIDKIGIPDVSLTVAPPVGFHFEVVFFALGVGFNPLDTKFRKVSGLSAEITTTSFKEGGENLFSHRFPDKVSYGNLKLERGMVTGSPLGIEFNVAMSTLQVTPGNVLVALLNDEGLPISAWLFWKTYPVKWSVSDLDADANSVVIETMELAYKRFQTIKI